MINQNLNEKDNYTNSIREHLQIIGNILFDHNGCSKKHLSSSSKAELAKSIDYLEKERGYLPHSYIKGIDYIIKEVRCKLAQVIPS